MDDKTIVAGVLMDENTTFSFVEICQKCNISEDMLLYMIEHGLCNHQQIQVKNAKLDAKMFGRIQSASRLQRDLGINTPGVVLVLELLDDLERLRNELAILQRHVNRGY